MKDTLQRWWQWETRYFRKDGATRPGERTGAAVAGAIVLVGIVVTVLAATVR